MIFRRDIEPNCAYCEYAERADGNGEGAGDDVQGGSGAELQCAKRGSMPPEASCKSFRYDPLKRIPPRPATLRRKFREEDFSL